MYLKNTEQKSVVLEETVYLSCKEECIERKKASSTQIKSDFLRILAVRLNRFQNGFEIWISEKLDPEKINISFIEQICDKSILIYSSLISKTGITPNLKIKLAENNSELIFELSSSDNLTQNILNATKSLEKFFENQAKIKKKEFFGNSSRDYIVHYTIDYPEINSKKKQTKRQRPADVQI